MILKESGQVRGRDSLEGDPEVKSAVKVCQVTQTDVVKGTLDKFFDRYSTWNALRKGVAWLLRFKTYLCSMSKTRRDTTRVEQGRLSVSEIADAENAIFKYVQRVSFLGIEGDVKELPVRKWNRDSRLKGLIKLHPVLIDGVMRVGGRIKHAPVSEDVKHPIILPCHHHVTGLIIVHFHAMVGHSGAGMTWSSLRQKFWVVRGGGAVRRVLGKCFLCRKRNAPLGKQIMANLPPPRVTPEEPPVTFTGVDYFGPLYVKQGRSYVKR
ncbi:hypothetical protein HOLleu_40866 [Holothuria leucospilota]|uniref:Integrase zinc-binding domain-containing protein n=1 Tax=Holothuria leucospilota TaxID=206669 RepID=A0A9Q1BBZ9_HOLLE|nr:hypothetical protein HOLleu_40866 [Holothuria leucospilota]